jgi:opacity protein-like surface antigen
MKKLILLSVLAAVVAGGAFAAPDLKLSAGAGGYFASDFGGGIESSRGGQTSSSKTPYIGGGGFAFFDATYAEVSVGFLVGSMTREGEGDPRESSESKTSFTGLDIGLLGKYPIAISEQLSVFPALGITYRAVLSAKDEDGNSLDDSGFFKSGDLSALWINFGGGLDFAFTDHIYLRGGLLYGLRLANKFEEDMVDMSSAFGGGDAKTLLGHGLEVKIAVGYQF